MEEECFLFQIDAGTEEIQSELTSGDSLEVDRNSDLQWEKWPIFPQVQKIQIDGSRSILRIFGPGLVIIAIQASEKLGLNQRRDLRGVIFDLRVDCA